MRFGSTLALIGSFPLAVAAPAGADCGPTRDELREELAKRYASPDDPAVLERRNRIELLFARASPACAEALHDELGPADDGGELSHAFHYALATPTRKRLLGLLETVYSGLRGLQREAEGLSDSVERRELGCWLARIDALGTEADDRVIEWSRVDGRGDELAALVEDVDDVDALDSDAGLFTHVFNVYEMSALEGSLARLQQARRGARDAIREFEAHAADDPPPHLEALWSWVEQQREESDSLLSCL